MFFIYSSTIYVLYTLAIYIIQTNTIYFALSVGVIQIVLKMGFQNNFTL